MPNAITGFLKSNGSQRRISRNLVANNPIGATASRRWVSSMIGSGIKVLWGDEFVQQLWNSWALAPNSDDYGDFLSYQTLAAKGLFDDGEVFTRFVYSGEATKENPITLRLQMLNSDILADTGTIMYSNGGSKISGITVDQYLRPVAYDFYSTNMYLLGASQYTTIPAAEIIHLFKKNYVGQFRGTPYLSAVFDTVAQLDELFLATLKRQKNAQAISYIVKRQGNNPFPFLGDMTEDQPVSELLTDRKFKRVSSVEAGSVVYLNDGEDVSPIAPTDIGDNLVKVFDAQLRLIAASIDLTFEQLSNNLSQVNYSSARVGMLTVNRVIAQQQQILLISIMLKKITDKFLALVTAEFGDKYKNLNPVYQTPKVESIDREKEAKATLMELQTGLTTLELELAKRNLDYETIVQQLQKEHDLQIVLSGQLTSKKPKNTKKGDI